MPEPPDWVRTLGELSPLFGFLLGIATRRGADRNTMTTLRKSVEQLEKARIEQGGTLAVHTALHDGYVRTQQTMQATVTKVSEDVSYIRGRLDANRPVSG